MLAALALCASCDVGYPAYGDDGPGVHDSQPIDGQRDVPRLGPFRVRFDRRVVPRTVNRGTVYILSGVARPLMSTRYDVLTQSAVLTPLDGTPLEPGLDYRIVVENVVDLDGITQAERWTSTFHTGDDEGPGPPAPAPSSWVDVAPIFSAHCSGTNCHGPGPVAVGLDLSTPEAARATAVNVVAQTLPAGTATTTGAAAANGLVGMRIVDAPPLLGHPETSYLVYTVLGDRHIALDAMPPPSSGVAALDATELRTLSDWIVAGAPTTEP